MSDETLKLPGLPKPIRDRHGVPLFGSDQVRELQRQTVEVCAKVCARLAARMLIAQAKPEAEPGDRKLQKVIRVGAQTCEENILALLKDHP